MKKLISLAVLVFSVFVFSAPFAYAQAAAGGGASLMSFLPIILIFVFFWFFLLRPQQKKAKEHQKMLNELKKDDKVIACGGMYATVVGVKGDMVDLKIAENVVVVVAKPAITVVIKSETAQPQDVQTPDIIKK
jgi:preprotein translocase subunit YajC